MAETLRLHEIPALVAGKSAGQLAGDEMFWAHIRRAFVVPDDFVHLEYGYYHPSCQAVIDAEVAAIRSAQRRGSHYKRSEMSADLEMARADLARIGGVSPEEVVITRNTTEALNIVISGISLRPGDEVVCSNQDYPSMVEAWEQRMQRSGVKVNSVPIPLHPSSDDEMVERFAATITPRTRVLFVTHVINLTGHVLPVAKLCALGRKHGLQIIVDAAHSFGQLDFSIASLDCDYLAASLHKWLAAPLGTGLLYVRRERISEIEPLFADVRQPRHDIRKLEHFGNRPDSAHIGLREAIRWHEAIGAPVKSARLHWLQRRWTDVARTLPRVKMLTPAAPSRHAAIGAFAIDGMNPRDVVAQLLRDHGFFVNAIEHLLISGVRVTPGLPTSAEQIDRFSAALKAIAEGG